MCDDGVLVTRRTPGGHRRIAIASIEGWLRDQGDLTANQPTIAAASKPNSPTARAASNLQIAAFDAPVSSPYRQQLKPAQISQMLDRGDFQQVTHWMRVGLQQGLSPSALLDNHIAPAMLQTADAWNRGDVDLSREHLRTCLMKKALTLLSEGSVASLNANQPSAPNTPLALGGCLEQERHVLSSTMIEISLRLHGWRAISLGATLPLNSLIQACQEMQPRLIWVSYTFVSDPARIVYENHKLHASLGEAQSLAIGGQGLPADLLQRMRYHFTGPTLHDLVTFADQLQTESSRATTSQQPAPHPYRVPGTPQADSNDLTRSR